MIRILQRYRRSTRVALCFLVLMVPAAPVWGARVGPDRVEPDRRDEQREGNGGHSEELRDLADAVRSLQIPEKPEDPRYQKPCQNVGDDDHSDLCAQWTAAEAAARSAQWTEWGCYASLAGIVGLLINIAFTIRALSQTRKGLELATQSVEASNVATKTALAEFEERMRPRCVVSGMVLVDKWQEHVNAGNDLPLVIVVQNMGGATGRKLAILIERIELLDHARNTLWSYKQLMELAPLRAGQIRSEGMLLPHSGCGKGVDRIVISGKIGSRGDELVDGWPVLTMFEDFVWTENPLYRGSQNLVEGIPGRGAEADDHQDYRSKSLPFMPESAAAGA